MRLTLNDQPLAIPDGPVSLAELLEHVSRSLAGTGQFLSEVAVDGSLVPDFTGDDPILEQPMAGFDEVTLVTDAVEQAIHRGFLAVQRHLPLLGHLTSSLPCELEELDPQQLSERLALIADVLGELVRFLALSAQQLGESQNETLRDRLLALCDRLEHAHRNQDQRQVLKILQGEIPETLVELESWTHQLQTRQSKVHERSECQKDDKK